jgi:transcriptional regulator with XRE-family HTH domain
MAILCAKAGKLWKVDMPKKDTVPPDGAKIRRLRQELGLTKEEFAEKAECSRRSIYNAESGLNIELTTLKCIADAFKVSAGELILGVTPQPSPNLIRLQLVIEADMDKLNQSHALESLVSLLRSLIPASGEIVLKDVRRGSVVLSLEMEEQDALGLVAIMPSFSVFARDVIRENIEQQIRRAPNFPEQLNQAISRRPDGSYFVSANVAAFNEATFFIARQTDLLRLIDGVKELRIPAGSQPTEGERFSDIVSGREVWEVSPELLGMAGYKTDSSYSG